MPGAHDDVLIKSRKKLWMLTKRIIIERKLNPKRGIAMAEVDALPVERILSTSLHHIDLVNSDCRQMAAVLSDSDMEGYLSDLLKEIRGKEQRKTYQFDRDSTEFYRSLVAFISTRTIAGNPSSEQLAQRLLEKELQTEARYGHLGPLGRGHIKRGSFLQFLYQDGGILGYLGVKVEHQSFLDENDFKKKVGLSIENKIYKACMVTFSTDGLPASVLVFDTNAKPSTYWWQAFLELTELRNDTLNTRKAVEEVVKVLNGIKKNFPVDHTILRNSTIAAFRQIGTMRFDEFVAKTFESYVPTDPALAEKLPKLAEDLHALPTKKNFDSLFELVPSEVPFKKKKIDLSKEVSITFDEGMVDLDRKIWAEIRAGQKLVVIDSPEGFDKFVLKTTGRQ